jgi:purine nucleoside phosphorylase
MRTEAELDLLSRLDKVSKTEFIPTTVLAREIGISWLTLKAITNPNPTQPIKSIVMRKVKAFVEKYEGK